MTLLIISFDMSKPKNGERLRTIYKSVKSFMSFRSVPTPVGYLIDDEASFADKFSVYRERWIACGGRPDGIQTYCFDIICASAATARMVTNSICDALYSRLASVLSYYDTLHSVSDKRRHMSAAAMCKYAHLVYTILPAAWLEKIRFAIEEAASKLKSTERITDGIADIRAIMNELAEMREASLDEDKK